MQPLGKFYFAHGTAFAVQLSRVILKVEGEKNVLTLSSRCARFFASEIFNRGSRTSTSEKEMIEKYDFLTQIVSFFIQLFIKKC